MAGVLANRSRERFAEERQFTSATHQRRIEARRMGRGSNEQLADAIRVDWLLLPLDFQRLELVDADRVPRQPIGDSTDENLPGGGALLEPLCHVDRVSRYECFTPARIPGDDFPAVDTGAEGDPNTEVALELGVQADQFVVELHGSSNCPERIVFVHLGNAEHGHHGVADELLDGATMMFEDRPGRFRESLHHTPQLLGIVAVPEGGRVRNVREENGDRLSGATDRAGRAYQVETTSLTEPRPLICLLSASGTEGHVKSVTRPALRGNGAHIRPGLDEPGRISPSEAR
jgi:hypothetical protein